MQYPHSPSSGRPGAATRRPRRRLRKLTVFHCAGIGLRPLTRDSAAADFISNEAHWLWFIFIQAHRFSAPTALPSTPRGGTGVEPFRREPPNSTGGTFTHELASFIGCFGQA